jgi:glycosyltransferase involved in cell wall biosynthesis
VTVALVHDYLTQRGGAERVVLSLRRAFPDAPIYTSLYDPAETFPEFGAADVRPLPLNLLAPLRRRHRLALGLLAPSFSRLRVEADVVVCSSSGWAHGTAIAGRKIVYCHAPARWLYQADRYLGERPSRGARAALRVLRRSLAGWDRRAAASANRYLVNSTAVQARVAELYGIDAEVVAPPPALDPTGPAEPVPGLDGGFVLCVSRLLPYKNVAAVCEAFRDLPATQLIVAGSGPGETSLRREAPPNVTVLGAVDDARLRWLYRSCVGLVAASYEDYGLTPLEAAAFGKPSAVLRFGGFVDTVADGETGVFFDAPVPADVRDAVVRLLRTSWDPLRIGAHAEGFSEPRFVERMRQIVTEEEARP